MQSGIFAGRRKCGFKSIPKSPAGEGGKGAQFVRRCVGKAEEKFILERVEKVCWNGKPVYLWGLAVPVQEGRG